jgi:hypothetical protein
MESLLVQLGGVEQLPTQANAFVGAVHVYAGATAVSRASASPSQTICDYVTSRGWCQYSFPRGTVVTLIAVDGPGAVSVTPQHDGQPTPDGSVPANAAEFVAWAGCTSTPEEGVCVVNLDQALDPCGYPSSPFASFELMPNVPLFEIGSFDLDISIQAPTNLAIPPATANPVTGTQSFQFDDNDALQFVHWYWLRRGSTMSLQPKALPGLAFQQWSVVMPGSSETCPSAAGGNICELTFDGTGITGTEPYGKSVFGFSEFWDCGLFASRRANTGNCACRTTAGPPGAACQ